MNEFASESTTNQVSVGEHGGMSAAEFAVGGVLGRTFSALRAHPLVFLGMASAVLFPCIAVRLLAGDGLLQKGVQAILCQLIPGAVAYAALQAVNGRAVSFGASLARGSRHIGSLLAISILTSVVAALGIWFLFYLPLLIFGRLGLFVAVPLVLWAGSALFCAVPVMISACVIENLRPIQSINRSTELTKGCRLKIFALFLVAGAGVMLILKLLPIAIDLLFFWSRIAQIIVINLALLFPAAFALLMCPMIYFALREAKEGVSVDSLTSVFD